MAANASNVGSAFEQPGETASEISPMKKTWAERVSEVSMIRVFGFGLVRLWTFVLFYSVMPYLAAGEARSTLYENQTISLFAFVLGAGLIFSIYKPRTYTIQSRAFIYVGGVFAAIGTLMCGISDVSTPQGMLLCALSAVMTGVGSAFLFVLWVRMLFGKDRSVLLIEYGAATAMALVLGLVFMILPGVISLGLTAAAPMVSAVILAKLMSALMARKHESKKDSSEVFESRKQENAGGFLFVSPSKFSKSTKMLFAKSLIASLIFGFLAGFTDIVSGYSAFSANDSHGVAIFLVGILAALLMMIIGLLCCEPLDLLYRVAMLFMGIGFVLLSLMETGVTFYTALSLAGYSTLIAFMILCCHIIYRSFRTGATQTIALCIGVLYLGEALGLVCGDALVVTFESSININLLSILCTIAFLVTALLVFTEGDLTHAGIGELETEPLSGTSGDAANSVAGCPQVNGCANCKAASDAAPDPVAPIQHSADLITKRFGLSRRESEVLLLLLQGRTMARIQETLFISAGTVSTHTRHIYQKVGVPNRQALLDLAFSGELDAEEMQNQQNL